MYKHLKEQKKFLRKKEKRKQNIKTIFVFSPAQRLPIVLLLTSDWWQTCRIRTTKILMKNSNISKSRDLKIWNSTEFIWIHLF